MKILIRTAGYDEIGTVYSKMEMDDIVTFVENERTDPDNKGCREEVQEFWCSRPAGHAPDFHAAIGCGAHLGLCSIQALSDEVFLEIGDEQ